MTVKKWKSFFRWTGWIAGFVSRFLPSNIKVWVLALSTLSGGVVTLLDSCDKPKSPSDPLPIATPSPIPTPIPTPTKPPLPELRGPSHVKAGTPFWIELCNIPNTYNVHLYANSYRLGYMGFGKPCMKLNVVLNQRGKRTLIAVIPDKDEVKMDIVVQ